MRVLFANRQVNLFQEFAYPHFKVNEDYQIIDKVLSNEEIICELAKDIPDTDIGRDRMPVEQTLRILILKTQRQLSYRDLERTLNVNLEDRWFCKINEEAPCFKSLQNQLALISGETIKAINLRVMEEARRLKLTKGGKMRVDSTVVSANIHYPTDAGIMADGIAVISRTVKKLNILPKGYRTFKRTIKKQIYILRNIGRKCIEARNSAIKAIAAMAKKVIRKTSGITEQSVVEQAETLKKIVDQTEQVLAGQKIKNRIVSFYDQEARPIVKGKIDKPCEFGYEVQVQEDERFVTNWEVSNKPRDHRYFPEAVDKHKEIFGKAPKAIAADRHYYSKDNVQYAKDQGVKYVAIPKKGKPNAQEKEFQHESKFIVLQHWRAGCEAKISWLKRKFGLRRCGYKGAKGLQLWVGAGILTANLLSMAKLLG